MSGPQVSLRPARESDGEILHAWASDPDARAASFHPEAIPWDTHVAWFRRSLSDPGCTILIIETARGTPVGTVRFHRRDEESAVVSLTIGKQHRGQGYGTAALRAAAALAGPDIRTLVAIIRVENVRSARTFRNAGYLPAGRTTVNGHEAVVMRHERPGPAAVVPRRPRGTGA